MAIYSVMIPVLFHLAAKPVAPAPGFSFGSLIPTGSDLSKVLGLWIVYGVVVFVASRFKSNRTTAQLVMRIVSHIARLFAFGATLAAIPIVGKGLTLLLGQIGATGDVIFGLGLAWIVAAELSSSFPAFLQGKWILLIVAAIAGFAANGAPGLDVLTTGISALVSYVLAGVEYAAFYALKIVEFLQQHVPSGGINIPAPK